MRIAEHAIPPGWVSTPLLRAAEINPKAARFDISVGTLVDFLPMRAVRENFGGVGQFHARPFEEVRRGFTQFQAGDIVFAKITPCMENGKVAIVPALRATVGYGSTEFHVVRAGPAPLERWVAYFLSREAIRRLGRRNMTGSAGQAMWRYACSNGLQEGNLR